MDTTSQNIAFHHTRKQTPQEVWEILKTVTDPEIPVLSVIDLGIVREVHVENENVEVIITPTYSGCPAMDFIGMNVRKTLLESGFEKIKITHQLSPSWTTDWLTEEGKERLKSYGIAPPTSKTFDLDYLKNLPIPCPRCDSMNTKLISQFGSTACKALYQCEDCREPFDYFKCH
jgi:ring-1,2-phenylacetyl-CoA epoxidase subunit PaaD